MSGGVRVDEAALNGVATSIETRQGTLNDPGVDLTAPDAGRSTDELGSAIAAVTESLGELATGLGTLAGNIHSAIEDYNSWDASTAGSTPNVVHGTGHPVATAGPYRAL